MRLEEPGGLSGSFISSMNNQSSTSTVEEARVKWGSFESLLISLLDGELKRSTRVSSLLANGGGSTEDFGGASARWP